MLKTQNQSLLVAHRSFFFLLFSLFSVLCSLFSCKTVPKTPDVFPDDAGFIPLEPGARTYIVIDVPNARPLLEHLNIINNINNDQVQQMLDQTKFAAAAVYQTENLRNYRLAAWGSYPVSRAKMALGASKDWKKRRSSITGDDYWYSSESGLSIAMTGGMALVATSARGAQDPPNTLTDPFSAAPGTVIPEGFNEFRKRAIFSCWIEDAGPGINQKFREMGIPFELPAQQFFISLFPVDEQLYEARLRIQFASETQARALTTLFSLARGFLSFSTASDNSAVLGSILFANPPVQDGNELNITTAPLSGREISLLFTTFSL